MEYENKILNLFKNGYLTTKDVTDNNIPRTYLTKLIKENKIERVGRGVYIKKNVLVDEFVVLQSKSMTLQLKVVTKVHFKKKRMLIYFIQRMSY